jgi:hypothetical protein
MFDADQLLFQFLPVTLLSSSVRQHATTRGKVSCIAPVLKSPNHRYKENARLITYAFWGLQ